MAENFGAFVRRLRDQGSGVFKFKGALDCSANPNYPVGQAGDVYKVSVAGKIGGASGPDVQAGDEIYCTADAAAGNHATVGASWAIVQGNITSTADVPASTDKNYVTDAQLTVIGNTSGTNTGDQTLPVKATGAELNTGTDDAKFATALALANSDYIKVAAQANIADPSGGVTQDAEARAAIVSILNILETANMMLAP